MKHRSELLDCEYFFSVDTINQQRIVRRLLPYPGVPLPCLALKNVLLRGFPGTSVVKNPPAIIGDTSLILGLGRSQVLQNN